MRTVKIAVAIVACAIQAYGAATVTASRDYVDRRTALVPVTNNGEVVGFKIGIHTNDSEVLAAKSYVDNSTPGNYETVSNAAISAAAQTNEFLRKTGGTMTGSITISSGSGLHFNESSGGNGPLGSITSGSTNLTARAEMENYVTNITSAIKTDRITDGTNTIDASMFVFQSVTNYAPWRMVSSTNRNIVLGTIYYDGNGSWTNGETTLWYDHDDDSWAWTGSFVDGRDHGTEYDKIIYTYYWDGETDVGMLFIRDSYYGEVIQVGKLALTNDIDYTSSNTQLVATIEATAPAPGNYPAVSNAAMNARGIMDFNVRGAPEPGNGFFIVDGEDVLTWIDTDDPQDVGWYGSIHVTTNSSGYEVVGGPSFSLDSDFTSAFEYNGEEHVIVGYTDEIAFKRDIRVSKISDGTNTICASRHVFGDTNWVVNPSFYIGDSPWYYGETITIVETGVEGEWWRPVCIGDFIGTGKGSKDSTVLTWSPDEAYIGITARRGSSTPYVGMLALTNDIPISKVGENSYEIYGSIAQGTNATASGAFSHAEGDRTVAQGKAAHAEGISTKALGDGSHSSGINTHVTQRGTFAAGVNISGTNSLSFIWNGNETSPWYGTHGKGTFNVNPANGLNGFYIGDSTLQEAIVNSLMDTSVTNNVEVEVDGSNTTSFVTNHVPTIRTAVLSAVEDKIPEWPVELVRTNTPLIFADGQDTNVTSLALRAQPENYTSLSFMYPVSYYLPNRFSLLELGHEYQIAAAQWFQVGRYMFLPSPDRLVFCNGGQHRTFQEYLDACSPEIMADLLSCYIPTNGGGRIHGDLTIDGRLTAGELITITNSDIHAKGFQVVNKVLTADGLMASNGMVRLNCARFVIGFGTPRIHLETNSPSAITYGGTWEHPAGSVFSWQDEHIQQYLAGNVNQQDIELRNPYVRYMDVKDGFMGWKIKGHNVNNGPLKHFTLDNYRTHHFTDADVGNYGIEFTISSNAHVRIVYDFATAPPSAVYFACGRDGNDASATMLSSGTELLSPTAGVKTLIEIDHLSGWTFVVKETPLTYQNTVMPWVDAQEESEP